MDAPHDQQRTLPTPGGDLPLHEYHLRAGGRAWAILHTGAVLSRDDETQVIGESRERLPYGVALWPAALALAHEVLARADSVRGARILELGAGTGLPGIVAATLGARVVQTDRNELVLSVCQRNGARNGAPPIDYRLVDWAEWDDDERYDWIIGADILYGAAMHAELRGIFERNLAPGGRILLTDPFRAASMPLLEALDADGWGVAVTKWNIGEDAAMRPVGLFELTPPTTSKDC